MACQPTAPPSSVHKLEELEAFRKAEDIYPVCTPTGRVRIDERRLLAFEMDCVDHQDPTLKMLGVARRFPEMKAGWYEGPFSNAAFLPMPGMQTIIVFYKHKGEERFRALDAGQGGDWDFSLGNLYPGPLELGT